MEQHANQSAKKKIVIYREKISKTLNELRSVKNINKRSGISQ